MYHHGNPLADPLMHFHGLAPLAARPAALLGAAAAAAVVAAGGLAWRHRPRCASR